MQHVPKFEVARRTVVLFSLSVGLLLIWIALPSSSAVTFIESDTYPPKGDLTWDLPALDVAPVSCVGPRGLRLNESIDDQLQSSFHDLSIYPEPISGSFEALGLNEPWTTIDEERNDDKQNLRSIVTEAALASHGKYNVFLLVDVKDLHAHVHSDDAGYASVLEKSVPQEFRDMAVLFDTTMLESWYPAVLEHSPFWQMMQPLQLFSQLYPEYDRYWQLEMDVRVTQHVGQILDAFDKFGEDQPRKQSHERASWSYMPRFHGTYAKFTEKINSAMPNGTGTWGPIRIGKEISPIGPKPPSPKSYDTEANWEWGVGEPADLLFFNTLMDVRRLEDLPFRHWHYGFTKDKDLPYWHSPPAQGRASWNLLNAIHHAQSRQDLRIASETTLPSFALWHGLKLVGLPLPIFQDPERNRDELNFVLNGGDIEQFPDGFANGPVNTRGATMGFFVRGRSFDWVSPMPDRTMAYWKGEKQPDVDMPKVLVEKDGKIYAPAMFMHPRKTNLYRSD